MALIYVFNPRSIIGKFFWCSLDVFSVLGKKNKKMKGKTFGLTEFLADGSSGSGAVQTVIARKSTNWADDVENDDGRLHFDAEVQFINIIY